MLDPTTGDKFVVLTQGYRYTGIPGTPDYQIAQFASYGVRVQQNAIPAKNRTEATPTLALWQQARGNPDYAAELQWRIALPLSALVLTLISVPLSKVKPRQGRYARLVPAFLLYILYVNLLFASRAWIEDGVIPPTLGLWWVTGVMACIGLGLLLYFLGYSPLHTRFFKKTS